MTVHSAGILLFRRSGSTEFGVLLVHPGGPFFAKKDVGVWSIPKGEYDPAHENALGAARREFNEETGGMLDGEPFSDLGSVEQRGGKMVHAFAFEGAFEPTALVSNEFEMEWPPKSGLRARFPEVDRAAWFGVDEARKKILPAQVVFLDRLVDAVRSDSMGSG